MITIAIILGGIILLLSSRESTDRKVKNPSVESPKEVLNSSIRHHKAIRSMPKEILNSTVRHMKAIQLIDRDNQMGQFNELTKELQQLNELKPLSSENARRRKILKQLLRMTTTERERAIGNGML